MKRYEIPILMIVVLVFVLAGCNSAPAADAGDSAEPTSAQQTPEEPAAAAASSTIAPTATNTAEPANFVIGPETLGQIRLLWSIAGPTENHPIIECSPTKQVCPLSTNIGDFAFSPDGNMLAVGVCLGVRIWEQTVEDLEDHRCTAESVIILYDSATGEEKTRFTAATIPLSLAFHPDGAILAVGLANNNIDLLDLASGEVTATLETGGRYFGVPTLDFTPDGTLLISASEGQMQIWDWGTATRLERILATQGRGGISPDSKRLTLLHYDSTGTPDGIRVYDIVDPNHFSEIPAEFPNARLFYFNPGNGWLALVSRGAVSVNFWDPATKTMVGSLEWHQDFEETGVSYKFDNGGFTPEGYFLITYVGYPVGEQTPADTPLSQLPQYCGFALFDAGANQIFHLPEMGTYDSEYQGQVFAVTQCVSPEYMYGMGLLNETNAPRILSPDGRFIAGEDVEGTFYVWGVDPDQPIVPAECFGDC